VEAPLSTVLVGFMGAGKSTAARALDPGAIDVDAVLEERFAMSCAEIFAREGEAAFRAAEEEETLRLLDGAAAVALGGGALGSARVRGALHGHEVVWLDVDPEVAWVRAEGAGRPLAHDKARFFALHREREAAYAQVATVTVLSGGRVTEALAFSRPPQTRLLWGLHPVVVGDRGDWWPLEGRRFSITDEHVAAVLDVPAPRWVLRPGEESKTLAACEAVWRWLATEGATRSDHLAAVGGGVVGDLAGFCASAYQRGVPVVQVPTTLVALVDAALGGKTGVDLPEAKNYVGAYHQPAAVLLDVRVLASLPDAERAAGYAEVVKTALIAGGGLWERVRGGAEPDEEMVLACARTKLRVVGEDERDGGRRQVLNLGHTVAHAVETVTGYGRYRHGEAVGLGLLAALSLSGQDALRAEVEGLLLRAGLPTRLAGEDPDEIIAATVRDKKRVGEGPTPFVLLRRPGEPVWNQRVGLADLLGAVEELAG
jgi:shikimate kinase/3-dehydroquinate synthase